MDQDLLLRLLSERMPGEVHLYKLSPIGGGCINDALRAETSAGVFFVKHNNARQYPGMFEAEARGLALLKGASGDTLGVPEVITYGESQDQAMLVLEFIEEGRRQEGFWEAFGHGLAQLHRQSQSSFGLDHPNYIGSLPQSNQPHPAWIDFFVEERLEPQLRMARDSEKAGSDLSRSFQALYPRLGDFFPEERPSLLHGDLWSGNFMADNRGRPALIDPAVYYGHRYMDLGMSQLFGGFASAFYDAYHQALPLEPSWRQSMDIANLYPLMVHVNLFGGGYLGSVQRILRRFV